MLHVATMHTMHTLESRVVISLLILKQKQVEYSCTFICLSCCRRLETISVVPPYPQL